MLSASGSCRTSCARSLSADLVQDLSVMMSASGPCRASCARSLYEDLLSKISLAGCLHQDPVGPLVQDLCMWISCARSFCQDLCIRLHQDPVGPLVQDLCMKSEIATLPAFRAMDTHDLRRRLHFEIRNRNFTCIPRTRHARSPQRVALRNQKTQFHLHSAHSTCTISAEGCTSKSKNGISPAFCALDTHDLRRGFTFRNHASEVLRLPRNHEPRSYEMLHWPRKRILKLKFQNATPLRN